MSLIYLLFVALLLSVYIIGYLKTRKVDDIPVKKLDLQQISVIIPYRDEAQEIPHLLHSIQQQSKFPLEIIFVNDHSTDGSELLVFASSLAEITQKIDLPATETGKKAAIRAGIELAKGSFILTWDADILLPQTYFEALQKQNESDLLILPVRMNGKQWYAPFFELDYAYLPNLQFALSGFGQYFVCSGANLLFRKESYLNYNENTTKASGDDVFLLRSMKQSGQKISLSVDKNLQVETGLPKSFLAVLHQRLRWIGKTNAVGDPLGFYLGLIALVYHFFPLIWMVIFPSEWYVLGLKIVIDSILFFSFLKQQGSLNRWSFVPFFSAFYPFYMLVIMILLPWFKPQWKGRVV